MSDALSSEQRELLLQLFEDVAAMEKPFGFPSSAELRTTFAPVLRRWIVDKMFFRMHNFLPNRVLFTFYSHTDAAKACQAGAYKWWMGLVNCGYGIVISPCAFTGESVLQPKALLVERSVLYQE